MLALDALDERFEIDAHRFGLLVCLRRRGRFCARACALAAHLRCSSARRSSSLGGASSERDVIVEILRHRLTHVLRRRTLALPLLRAIPVVALLLRLRPSVPFPRPLDFCRERYELAVAPFASPSAASDRFAFVERGEYVAGDLQSPVEIRRALAAFLAGVVQRASVRVVVC